MSAPKRIQMSRQHPWRAEHPDAVIVARPSKWGNPYKVVKVKSDPQWPGVWATVWTSPKYGDVLIGAHAEKADALATILGAFRSLAEDGHFGSLDSLRGRDLACWCPLEDEYGNRVPCHADVLLELANPGWTP